MISGLGPVMGADEEKVGRGTEVGVEVSDRECLEVEMRFAGPLD